MWIGIDIGSTTAKLIVLNDQLEIIDCLLLEVESDVINIVNKLIEAIKKHDIVSVGVTGSARKLISLCFQGECEMKSEILAHTMGAQLFFSDIGHIIEIGGQDSKYITLNQNIMADFKINSVCASGTGAFIAWQSKRLGLSVKEFDNAAMESQMDLPLTGKCSVFVESAIVNLQRSGYHKSDIARAICTVMAKNYCNEFIKESLLDRKVVFLGGVSRLKSMLRAFKLELNKEIFTHEYAQFMGAIGMAKYAKDNYSKTNGKILLHEPMRFNTKVENCNDCNNNCNLTKYISNNTEFLLGGRCGKF